MRDRKLARTCRTVGAALAALALVVADTGASAQVVDPGDFSIYSTVAGGGALATDFAFAPSEVFQSACLGGVCLYSATDPGFITRGDAPAGLHPLTSGTSVTLEIVAIADEASVLVGAKLLDAPGESAVLGAAPALHVHPTWQVTVPAAGSAATSFPVTFRLTTAAPYAASETYTLSLFIAGPGPTPSAAPTASPQRTATATPAATVAPTRSPQPTATPQPTSVVPTPTPSPRPSGSPTPRPSATPAATATSAATPSPEPTGAEPPRTPTPRPSPTVTARPSPRPSAAPTATVPGTPTPRPTLTPAPSGTPHPSAAPTRTPRPSPSSAATPTAGMPTPLAPGVTVWRSRGDQTLAYFDARDGFTSFVSVANTGAEPLVVRIDLRARDLRLVRSWIETLDAHAGRTFDLGALRAAGLPAEPGIAVVTALDGTGAAITSAALAGNFTVANLALGSAWGAPAIARRARLAASGAAPPPGTAIDGSAVVLDTIRPAAVELATYFAPDSLEPPEVGGNQVIFVSFDDVASAAPEVAPAAMRWVVEAVRSDGTPLAAAAVDTSGIEVMHLAQLLGADAADTSGRLELVARTPSADNRLVFFAQSLGTFATGHLLPTSRGEVVP